MRPGAPEVVRYSAAPHQKLGFLKVASYHEVGYKFDKYWDVDWFEKDVS